MSFNGYEFGDQGDVYSAAVPEVYNDDQPLTIEIEKVGGGEVGESYAGSWNYRVRLGADTVREGSDFSTGTEYTHAEVARQLADIIAETEYERTGDDSKLSERLALWASGALE